LGFAGFDQLLLRPLGAAALRAGRASGRADGRRLGQRAGHADGSDTGTISGDVGYGYYVAPRLSLGIRQSLTYNFIDDASDTWPASTIPFIEYSFGSGDVRPFLGAFVGAVYNEDEATGTAGPSAGLRWYLNDSTALIGRYRYE
jgi:hypothetical protein